MQGPLAAAKEAMRRPLASTLVLLALSALVGGSTSAFENKNLELRDFSLGLPGAPAAIISADLDNDGLQDLVVVVAYTEWSQIVTEESVEMDQVEESLIGKLNSTLVERSDYESYASTLGM